MKRSLGLLIGVILVALLTVSVAYGITNGQPDGGAHPYVGLIVFDVHVPGVGNVPAWRCTGSLLSDTVVLTAGHCTNGAVAARIWMDEIVQGNPEYPFSGASSYDGVPYTNPDFCIGCGNGWDFAHRDVGVIVLTEPVPASVVSDYVQLPAAGLVDTLANKTGLTLVGYGVQEQQHGGGPPSWTGLRVRLQAPTELIAANFVNSDEFIRITMNPGGGTGGICFGDSGGPDLLGDSDTVLAVNSYGNNFNCAGVGYSSRVDLQEVLDWIAGFMD